MENTTCALLKGQNLFGFVDGSLPCPASTLADFPNPAYAIWVQQDQLILSAIISSLTEELLPHVVGDFTSREVWDILAQLFFSHTRSRAIQLKHKLASIKKGSDPIHEYYDKIKKWATNLASIGEPLRESDHIAYILASLDASYDGVITSVHTMVTPPTIAVVYDLLIRQEERHDSLSPPIENPAAHMANRNSTSLVNPPRQPQYRRQDNYYSRGRNNNNSARGDRGRNRYNTFNSNWYTPRCQLCRDHNHIAKHCPHRYDPNFQGGSPNPSAYSAAKFTSGDAWYHDSGATHHITADLNNLNINSEGYTGSDHLQIGEGAGLSITHSGNGRSYRKNYAPR